MSQVNVKIKEIKRLENVLLTKKISDAEREWIERQIEKLQEEIEDL